MSPEEPMGTKKHKKGRAGTRGGTGPLDPGLPGDVVRPGDTFAPDRNVKFEGFEPLRFVGDIVAGGNYFRNRDHYWLVAFQGKIATIRPLNGMLCIRHLLARPGKDVPAGELMRLYTKSASISAGDETSASSAPFDATAEGLTVGELGDSGPILDPRAEAEYRRRLHKLIEAREDAERAGNTEQLREIDAETKSIRRELNTARGLGGRVRKAQDPWKRERQAVAAVINSAIRAIALEHPELARHLDKFLRTGGFCRYAGSETWSF